MLRTRVITAVILLLVLAPALLLLSTFLWKCAVLLVLMIAAWEWSRLASLPGRLAWGYILLTGIAGGVLLGAGRDAAFAAYCVAAAFWLVAVPLVFLSGTHPAGWMAAAAGWCVLLPFASAVVDLRGLGPWLLVTVMALVWIADVAAYFAGRAFGRHKLAPSISPGKTWEGVLGAAGAATLYALANHYLDNPMLAAEPVWRVILIVAALLTAVSILGDLFESLMKRVAGVKDSSHLLPGHGGVLDRIDSLTSTLPVAAFLLHWSGKL